MAQVFRPSCTSDPKTGGASGQRAERLRYYTPDGERHCVKATATKRPNAGSRTWRRGIREAGLVGLRRSRQALRRQEQMAEGFSGRGSKTLAQTLSRKRLKRSFLRLAETEGKGAKGRAPRNTEQVISEKSRVRGGTRTPRPLPGRGI